MFSQSSRSHMFLLQKWPDAFPPDERGSRRERLESLTGERGAGVCWRNCAGQCRGDPRSPSRRASRHQRSAVGACGFAGRMGAGVAAPWPVPVAAVTAATAAQGSRVWPMPWRGLCRPRHRLHHRHARRAGHWTTRILVADDLRRNQYESRRVDCTGSGGSASFRCRTNPATSRLTDGGCAHPSVVSLKRRRASGHAPASTWRPATATPTTTGRYFSLIASMCGGMSRKGSFRERVPCRLSLVMDGLRRSHVRAGATASATGAVLGRNVNASRAIGAFCSIDGCDAD